MSRASLDSLGSMPWISLTFVVDDGSRLMPGIDGTENYVFTRHMVGMDIDKLG